MRCRQPATEAASRSPSDLNDPVSRLLTTSFTPSFKRIVRDSFGALAAASLTLLAVGGPSSQSPAGRGGVLSIPKNWARRMVFTRSPEGDAGAARSVRRSVVFVAVSKAVWCGW